MDFLNQAAAQVRDLFKSMTPASRITTGLLAAVVSISLVYLFGYQSTGSDDYLLGGQPFSIPQIAKMQAALGEAGLSCELEGAQIKIPSGRSHEYMAALGKAGVLPVREYGDYVQKALNEGGAFDSKLKVNARLMNARLNHLSALISAWPGVETAAVFYDQNSQTGISRKIRAKATINVTPDSPTSLGRQDVANFREYVAGNFGALTPQNVTVNIGGRTYPGTGEDGMGGPMDDAFYSRKRQYEQETAQKIREQFGYIPGFLVSVNAELDSLKSKTETEEKYDPQSIPIQTTRSETTSERSQASPGGVVGVRSNSSGSNDPASVSASSAVANTNKESSEQETNHSVANKKTTHRVYHGYPVLSARATITVPESYYLNVWHGQNKPTDADAVDEAAQAQAAPSKADLEQIEIDIRTSIEKGVAPLLPKVGVGENSIPNVTVISLADLPGEEIPPPSMTARILEWSGRNWSTVSMMGLATFSLVMLRSMVKSVPSTAAEPNAPTADGPSFSVVTDEEDEADDTPTPKRKFARGPSLKDDLAGMVREDPDAAASILRGWISNTG
jgi:flagellar M-ring protein FliF